jgi:threonine aldolase
MSEATTHLPAHPRGFASDNRAGICPEAWAALVESNAAHVPSYGDDPWTARACEAVREIFETDCEVFFALTGTAANGLALAHLCQPYHSILCQSRSHVETDECGAPEFFTGGAKLVPADGALGKVDPGEVDRLVATHHEIHASKPKVLSLTQATECGTVYTVAELGALREVASRHGLRVHMDGARFANAVVTLGVAPREISWEAGVDVLCLGGTKSGALAGEAVIFFDRELAAEFAYRRKQAGQLASKLRFLTAPLVGLFETGAWLRNAAQANAMAALLAEQLTALPGVELAFPREASAAFVHMPPALAEHLDQRGWHLYAFARGAYRCMCAWDTTEEDVEALVSDARAWAGGVCGEDG